ncbi:TerD family protein [Shewanella morhuae]|uniref:General stress protein 16U n=1 Tax=Shewanella morhuae TaxID=365591 RepID=A0A380BX52_9GAMM|nr:TerD family protein [Shewanella morhuae]SUJ08710.1 General stress protein 16U [Shewanella morhuae]
MDLIQGGNAPVPTLPLTVRVISGVDVDVSAFRLYENNKVQDGVDMVFYGQPRSDDGAITLEGGSLNTSFNVNLGAIHAAVQKIAFTATVDGGQVIGNLRTLKIQVEQGGNVLITCDVPMIGRSEAALILGELYRRNAEWKFRFVSQGFNGGLKPLAEHFGVDVADEPAPTPTPTPTPTISLQKVTLSKDKPTISLTKQGDKFGKIRINLNWHRGSTHKGFSLFKRDNGVDLDLGAFVRTNDGGRNVIQALGNGFGSLNHSPFVELQDDDRTGDSTDGEWLFVNGNQWENISEVLVFAFIYEGVPNWESTDGVVTIHLEGQPPIETRLTEGHSGHGMCAIARLINNGGTIKVERINRYFTGHQQMDEAFDWGFRWKAGSK